ncbi:hypothetical protein SAMN02746041_03227 [Desulfacinum hydrothermale DSM 13146]|uniref:Uncharacterized protein n=1 Tax=Desulfacinum hydrothermale DSM 13146 TaxID=1121390 RepID=A0A1W1XWR1_9BACT|nr:hypothetical protein SAMN02746041_03227 [Desulfacinum hydrothermale DSM 13146]
MIPELRRKLSRIAEMIDEDLEMRCSLLNRKLNEYEQEVYRLRLENSRLKGEIAHLNGIIKRLVGKEV